MAAARKEDSLDRYFYCLRQLGLAEFATGDAAGAAKVLIDARELDAAGLTRAALNHRADVASLCLDVGDLERARLTGSEMEASARKVGDVVMLAACNVLAAYLAYWDGDWDVAVTRSTWVIDGPGESSQMIVPPRVLLGMIALAQGRPAEAREHSRIALETARDDWDVRAKFTALSVEAMLLAHQGNPAAAAALDEAGEMCQRTMIMGDVVVPFAVACVLARREPAGLEHLRRVPTPTSWVQAANQLLGDQPFFAAEACARIGDRPSEAFARMQAGQAHLNAGRVAEGQAEIAAADAFWRRVGATAWSSHCQSLVASRAAGH